jgi:hypothetical protein
VPLRNTGYVRLHLVWKTPDSGGAAISRYDIFRGTAAGGEGVTPIGSSITTKFDDTSADPAVTDYFYVVKAVNSVGTSNASNEIDLKIDLTPPQSPCALPGISILQDPSNDELDNQPAHDVQSVSIGEPFAFAPNKVVFTMKVQNLASLTPDTEWPITFNGPDNINYTVQMTTSPVDDPTNPNIVTNPEFQVFHTMDGSGLVQADPASNFPPDGTITIVIPRVVIVIRRLGAASRDSSPASLSKAGLSL